MNLWTKAVINFINFLICLQIQKQITKFLMPIMGTPDRAKPPPEDFSNFSQNRLKQ